MSEALPYRFDCDEYVVPIGISSSLDYADPDDLRSHVGHYIKVTGRMWLRGDKRNVYRAASCWYAEEDLLSKEDYQLEKKIVKMKVDTDALENLIGWQE